MLVKDSEKLQEQVINFIKILRRKDLDQKKISEHPAIIHLGHRIGLLVVSYLSKFKSSNAYSLCHDIRMIKDLSETVFLLKETLDDINSGLRGRHDNSTFEKHCDQAIRLSAILVKEAHEINQALKKRHMAL